MPSRVLHLAILQFDHTNMWNGCPVLVFCSCCVSSLPDELIRLINDGKVPLKARGDKRKTLTDKLLEARSAQVSFTRSLEVKGVSTYKALSVDRYKETHKGKHPHENGLTTTFQSLDGIVQEVVLVRQLPQGEWEVKVEDSTEIAKREELANSDTAIREGQLDDRLAQVTSTMTGTIGKAAICEAELDEKSEAGSSEPGDDEDGISAHDSPDDDGDDFMNLVLGVESDQKGKNKKQVCCKVCCKAGEQRWFGKLRPFERCVFEFGLASRAVATVFAFEAGRASIA